MEVVGLVIEPEAGQWCRHDHPRQHPRSLRPRALRKVVAAALVEIQRDQMWQFNSFFGEPWVLLFF